MWNKLLCGVGGDSAQQVNHGVLLLLNGLQMGNCSGFVRLDLCQFIYKVLEKIGQLFKNFFQLVVDILHKFTPFQNIQRIRNCSPAGVARSG